MKKFKDIAVVGMSGTFSEASSINEFYENIKSGRDSIRKAPKKRLELAGQDYSNEYAELGYLEDISKFDYNFFGISYKEAQLMDPQQRIALQEVCKSIWDSGHSLESFRGTKTAIIMACGDSGYEKLLSEQNGVSKIGNLQSVVAGRIAYELDLKGPVYVLDTSCSSSLLSVHQACIHLIMEEADSALAGGIAVNVLAPEQKELENDPLGIISKSGKVKAFDESADGSGGGEGCGFVLLKRLEDAIKDKDNIYAVIKGSSVNHDAARSNSLAAPSPVAQTEVILDAWEKAGIDPTTITYVEAHGTGTKIGDPIEIRGLTDSFGRYSDRTGFCAVSAAKTNIGHTGYNAGISSMIRGILAVYKKKKFPLVHFETPNKMINFENSAVYPCGVLEDWKEKVRRAGISSFGLSGTNVHMVLEQAPDYLEEKDKIHELYPVLVSAESEDAFRKYCKTLGEWIKDSKENIKNISYTLCMGRDKYQYKKMWMIKSTQELATVLMSGKDEMLDSKERPYVFICSNNVVISEEEFHVLKNISQDAAKIIKLAEKTRNTIIGKLYEVITQIIWYTEFKAMGLEPAAVIGCDYGNITVSYALNKISIEEAIDRAIHYTEENYQFNTDSFLLAIQRAELFQHLFVELGGADFLSNVLVENEKSMKDHIIQVSEGKNSYFLALCQLIERGGKVQWEVYFNKKKVKRVSLPTYPFTETECFIKSIIKEKVTAEVGQVIHKLRDYSSEDTKTFIRELWSEILEIEELEDNKDFFEIGGNSLMGMQVINRVKEYRGVTLEFDDLYDYSTIITLSRYIDELRTETEKELLPVRDKGEKELSYIQESMLFIYEQDSSSVAYNMPAIIKLKGELDVSALYKAVNYIIEKHEILHTVYKKEGGVYKPLLLDKFELPYVYSEETNNCTMEQLIFTITKELNETVFDLENEIPFKMKVIKVSDKVYLLSIVMHHIAADGWSIGILLQEISEYYKNIRENKSFIIDKLKMTYMDYAAISKNFMKSELGQKKIQFWKDQLKNMPTYLNFPTDKKRPEILNSDGLFYQFEFTEEEYSKILEFCKKHSVTPYIFLFAAYSILLYRYSNQTDFCIGTPVANRGGVKEEKIIGFFSNTLAIPIQIDGNQKIAEYLLCQKELLNKALSHQEIPFDVVVRELKVNRSTSYSPVFQHGFVLQNTNSELRLGDVEAEFVEIEKTDTKFDFMMVISQSINDLKGAVEYSTSLFEKSTMESLIEHYKMLIKNMIQNPENTIDFVPILTEKESDYLSLEFKDFEREDYYF